MEFVIDKTRLKINAHRKESTVKPRTRFVASNIKSAFIMNVKSPSVMMLSGRVRNNNIGLSTAFIIPITRAAIRAVVKLLT